MKAREINLADFEIIKSIGSGSFGDVSLVLNKKTKKQYAAKVSQKEISSEEELASFFREVSATSKVKNAAVLAVIGYNRLDFDGGEYPTLITEYASKGSLFTMFDNISKSMAPHEFTETSKYLVLLGISLGMKSLHSQGIIHRDLKPENVLLDDNYYPRICDFGLSEVSDDLNLSQIIMKEYVGTPLYMAPEIILGEQG